MYIDLKKFYVKRSSSSNRKKISSYYVLLDEIKDIYNFTVQRLLGLDGWYLVAHYEGSGLLSYSNDKGIIQIDNTLLFQYQFEEDLYLGSELYLETSRVNEYIGNPILSVIQNIGYTNLVSLDLPEVLTDPVEGVHDNSLFIKDITTLGKASIVVVNDRDIYLKLNAIIR